MYMYNLFNSYVGYKELDQIIIVLLTTNMFVAGFFGCIFDNTVPGTKEERGMLAWKKQNDDNDDGESLDHEIYNLPFCLNRVSQCEFAKYVPFLPYHPVVHPKPTVTTRFQKMHNELTVFHAKHTVFSCIF